MGRAQVSRKMIDTIYVALQTVLDEVEEPIPASNIWNFDETGHKIKYVKTFLYGLRGATKNNAESCGLGEHVTYSTCLRKFVGLFFGSYPPFHGSCLLQSGH